MAEWDGFWEGGGENVEIYPLRVSLFDRNASVKGITSLEVGSGTGIDSINLAQKGANVTCLDNSNNALDISKKLFKKYGVKGKFVNGDACNMCFEDNSFDLVFNAGVVEHFKDPTQIIQEMKRVSSKYVMVWVPQTFHRYTVKKKIAQARGKWPMPWETQYSIFGLKSLFKKNGIKPIDYLGSAPRNGSMKVKKYVGSLIGLEVGVLGEKQ